MSCRFKPPLTVYNTLAAHGEGAWSMDDDVVISLSGVSKCFRRYKKPIDRLKELVVPSNRYAEDFWALKDITLDIRRGETLGVIGQNGSGKSTLLQIIAGTLQPTSGTVLVKGRVSALLELGSGFNPEFTGRQNVFFNARILGLSQSEIENRFDEIVAFADIGSFIDQPVKSYSSGMFVRLAFAVAIHVNPQIFIVDEALAVGDVIFQHQCMKKIHELMESGVTTLFVSHDAGAVKALCNRSLMIHEGKQYLVGNPDHVIIEYLKKMTTLENERYPAKKSDKFRDSDPPKLESLGEPLDWFHSSENLGSEREWVLRKSKTVLKLEDHASRRGSDTAEIIGLALFNNENEWSGITPVFQFNEKVQLVVKIRANTFLESAILGFFLRDKNGYEIIGSNTCEEGHKLENLEELEEIDIVFEFNLPIKPGSYSLTAAIAENYLAGTSNWLDNILILQVMPPQDGKNVFGAMYIPMAVEINRVSRGY